jgi:hypothetical protein
MNAGGAPPDAPAQCPLADVECLLPCATADRQLRGLQGPPHPAPGLHIETPVYLPLIYAPARVA